MASCLSSQTYCTYLTFAQRLYFPRLLKLCMLLSRPFKQHTPGQIYHELYGESYDCAGCITHPESPLKEKPQ